MKLWLLRHAPAIAPAGLCYGRSDLAAESEATLVAASRIAPQLPLGVLVRSSPLIRCKALAHAVTALRPDLCTQYDARLAEMDFGAWEMKPWSAIDRRQFDAWMADFADARPGAGGGANQSGPADVSNSPHETAAPGESVRTFMRRVADAYDGWRAEGRDALWVTHVGVVRAVLLLKSGVLCPCAASDWPREGLDCGHSMTLSVESRIDHRRF